MRHLIIILIAGVLFSCSTPEKNELVDTNRNLVSRNISANAQLDQYKAYLSRVEHKLSDIRGAQEGLAMYINVPGESQAADPIEDHLTALSELLEDSRFQLGTMRQDLRTNATNLLESKRNTGRWSAQAQSYLEQVDSLGHALTEKVIALELLELHQHQLVAKILDQDIQQHKAFFAFGTWEELEAAGVAEKQGGLWGIGGRKVFKPDFDPNYFTALDTRTATRIPLGCREAKLLSHHPENSYSLDGSEGIDTLVIHDPEAFWRNSRYLAITVKQ